VIGTLPVHDLAPLDYRYALDAAMPLVANEGVPIVRCTVPALAAEVQQRLPRWSEDQDAPAALWVEPLAENWKAELDSLAAALRPGGALVVVASRPLARLLPERRDWPGEPLGSQPGGVRRLRRALRRKGMVLESEFGMHTLLAIALNLISRQAARWGRPDLGDRLGFAARLRYCTAGPLGPLSTVAMLVARRESSG